MEDMVFYQFYILTKLASTNEYSVVIDDGNTKHRVALAMTIGEIRKACKCLPTVNAPLNILLKYSCHFNWKRTLSTWTLFLCKNI